MKEWMNEWMKCRWTAPDVCCQELDQRNKSGGGREDVKLTKKQQEAVTAQIAKESTKRAALRQVLGFTHLFLLL